MIMPVPVVDSPAAWMLLNMSHSSPEEFNEAQARDINIEFFLELEKCLPKLIEEAGFNIICSTTCGTHIFAASKTWPNLFTTIDIENAYKDPHIIEFTYYINERIYSKFRTFIEVFDYIKLENKQNLFSNDQFDVLMMKTIRSLNLDAEPNKFKYISDDFSHDFTRDELKFDIYPEIKWCHLDGDDMKIEDIRFDYIQYRLVKLFTNQI